MLENDGSGLDLTSECLIVKKNLSPVLSKLLSFILFGSMVFSFMDCSFALAWPALYSQTFFLDDRLSSDVKAICKPSSLKTIFLGFFPCQIDTIWFFKGLT